MYRKRKVCLLLVLVALLLSAASGVVAQEPSPLEQIVVNYKQVQSDARLTDEEKIRKILLEVCISKLVMNYMKHKIAS